MGFHFTVNREDFLQAINAQQNITSKKGTMAVLSYVLLEAEEDQLVLTSTDLEIGLKHTVKAEIFGNGNLLLPSKKLFELVRESGSRELSFKEQDNHWVEIQADTSIYRLAGLAGDEFPKFPAYNEQNMIRIKSNTIADLIDKTIYSISTEKENIFTLNAALLSKIEKDNIFYLKMVSSDGHRLTIMNKEIDEEENKLLLNQVTLIPRKGIQEIRKFCEFGDSFLFVIEEKQAVLKTDTIVLVIRLPEGKFPDFDNLINSLILDNPLYVNRNRMLEGLRRINLFTEDIFYAVQIEIHRDNVLLTSQNADFGSAKDEFTVSYEGKSIKTTFNCRFLIESLQVMEAETVIFDIKQENNPCVIYSQEDEGFLSIIMPMKI